jgi:hypothetical protein
MSDERSDVDGGEDDRAGITADSATTRTAHRPRRASGDAASRGSGLSASGGGPRITGDGRGGAAGERVYAMSHAAPVIPHALGAGDDDGRHRGTARGVTAPLGPGESDGRSRGVARPVVGPLGPGESDGRSRGVARPVVGPLGPGESAHAAAVPRPVPRVAGPGDDDGVPRGPASSVRGPFGAGETDPRSPLMLRGAPVRGPAAPGAGPESEWIVRPPPAAGPGDLQVPLPIVRVKRKTFITEG